METILLVEDKKSTANALTKSLSELGMNTEVAYDGNTAMKLLNKKEYNGVILDLSLPADGPQGITILEWLSENKQNTAVVIVTGYKHLAFRALELGVDTLLMKPVDEGHIIRYMQRSIELRKLREENKRIKKILSASISSYIPGAVFAILIFIGLFFWRLYIPDDIIGIVVATIIACIGLIGSKRVTNIAIDLSKQKFQISASDKSKKKQHKMSRKVG